MTIAAHVVSIATPSCGACRASGRACPLGCDALPTVVTIRPEGTGDVFAWLADDRQVGACIRALAEPDALVIVPSDELDAIFSAALIGRLAANDAPNAEEVAPPATDVTRPQGD